MLVTFSAKVSADITMFGEVAVALLKLMGQTGGVPGALLAADVPEALQRLKDAIATSGTEPAGNPPRQEGEEEEEAPPPITLRQRAFPLIGLLEAAVRGKADVMWAQARNPLL